MTAARAPRKLVPASGGRLEPVEDLEAEVDAEQDPVDATVPVLLDGETVQVLPVRQWRSSATRALREGDFDSWAEKCLTDDSYKTVWQDIDPTIEQVEQFFVNWQAATGTDPKASGRSRSSSKGTRRR